MQFRVDARRAKRPSCVQCHGAIDEGYRWQAFGESITLCADCTADLQESVRSYGEPPDVAAQRFMTRLQRLVQQTTT
jgi:hypothetical protein